MQNTNQGHGAAKTATPTTATLMAAITPQQIAALPRTKGTRTTAHAKGALAIAALLQQCPGAFAIPPQQLVIAAVNWQPGQPIGKTAAGSGAAQSHHALALMVPGQSTLACYIAAGAAVAANNRPSANHYNLLVGLGVLVLAAPTGAHPTTANGKPRTITSLPLNPVPSLQQCVAHWHSKQQKAPAASATAKATAKAKAPATAKAKAKA